MLLKSRALQGVAGRYSALQTPEPSSGSTTVIRLDLLTGSRTRCQKVISTSINSVSRSVNGPETSFGFITTPQHSSWPPTVARTPAPSNKYQDANKLAGLAEIELCSKQEAFSPPAHPTLELMLQRWQEGTNPTNRRDSFKLGLIVEGGGMRGIISGAMLIALHRLGLKNVFDVVYGASAGAINSCYFLSSQPQGLDLYTNALCDSRFMDLSGLWTGRPVMQLDYLLEHCMGQHEEYALDWEAVLSSRIPLKMVASSLDILGPVLLDKFSSRQELTEALRATATVPQVAGPPRLIQVGGQMHQLVDAAIFEPVPMETAIKDGCTHLLVLCTRMPFMDSAWSKLVRLAVEGALRNTLLNAPYMRRAWAIDTCSADVDLQLASALVSCPNTVRHQLGSYVYPVFPRTTAGCHPLCTSGAVLGRAKQEGFDAIERVVGTLLRTALHKQLQYRP